MCRKGEGIYYWKRSKTKFVLNHFRLKQNKNTSRKLTFDLIFDPFTDSAGCVRLILIQD